MDDFTLTDKHDLMKTYSKKFKKFNSKLTDEQRNALTYYKFYGAMTMNKLLYGGPFEISKTKLSGYKNKNEHAKKEYNKVIEKIRVLDSLFQAIPSSIKNNYPDAVYRGTKLEDLKVGTTLITKGFLSTTLSPVVAAGYMHCEGCCIIKLILTGPIPYFYLTWNIIDPTIDEETTIGSEVEILLPRNLKIKVIETKKVSFTKNYSSCSDEKIKKSKKQKITLYICEIEDILNDYDIPNNDIKIIEGEDILPEFG